MFLILTYQPLNGRYSQSTEKCDTRINILSIKYCNIKQKKLSTLIIRNVLIIQ